jgi:hypothetical protein
VHAFASNGKIARPPSEIAEKLKNLMI